MNMVTSGFTATCSAPDKFHGPVHTQTDPHKICIRRPVAACYRSRPEDEMRKLFLALCMTLIAAVQAASQTSSTGAAATLTVIRAGSLIDGTSDAARKNQLIFIRGESIEKVADGSAA